MCVRLVYVQWNKVEDYLCADELMISGVNTPLMYYNYVWSEGYNMYT